ncbi:hypothetical protein BJX96DRAFT_180900 [Aspergillus floccosus]
MAPSRRSRTLGALLALHAGDALGAPLEFKPHTAPGAATDDTDLTRAVLLAYRDAILNGDDVITKAAEHPLAWYRGDH